MSDLPILSISIFLPIISTVFIIFFTNDAAPKKQLYPTYVAILSATLTLISAGYLLLTFEPQNTDYQFIERYKLIESIGLEWYLGIDGLSTLLIFLTALLTLICIIASLFTIRKNIKEFLLCFLLLESFCIGAFSALNLLLFYGLFEMILLPVYLIIGIWGGENRIYAALKFFLYTLAGSVFFLLALIYIYNQTRTFSMPELDNLLPQLSLTKQKLLWLLSFIAFAVKVPMFPFHTWLPDAHVQAPTTGSVVLAGILLKLGCYAFLRISLPMLPGASEEFALPILWLSGFTIIYASLIALVQTDMKKAIAYSSVAHMGYVTGGIFSFTEEGMNGAIIQMLSHGIIASALFLGIGMLYERYHTKETSKYGGVATVMPVLATCFLIATLASIGLPGLSGFIGEFLSIVGIFKEFPVIGSIYTSGIILGAVYMLGLYKKIMLGGIKPDNITMMQPVKDLSFCEKLTLLPLLLLMIFIGLFPQSLLGIIHFKVQMLASIYDSL